jgi:hypothetical protein
MKIESISVAAHMVGRIDIRGREWLFWATIHESGVVCPHASRMGWFGRNVGGSENLREEIAGRIAAKRAVLWSRAMGRIPVGEIADEK